MYIPTFENVQEFVTLLIPDMGSDALCPTELLHNAFVKRDVISTAESFKSWDTCMDNKTCKIVAIVGIVLAALVVFWLLSTVFRMICCGLEMTAALCCCIGECCSCGRNRNQPPPPQMVYVPRGGVQPSNVQMSSRGNAYNNPNMYNVHPQNHNENPFSNNYRY